MVTSGILSHTSRYWVGSNDLAREGVWVWSDGRSMPGAVNWDVNEPNNGGTDPDREQCVELFYKSEKPVLNDAPCTISKLYVCEKIFTLV